MDVWGVTCGCQSIVYLLHLKRCKTREDTFSPEKIRIEPERRKKRRKKRKEKKKKRKRKKGEKPCRFLRFQYHSLARAEIGDLTEGRTSEGNPQCLPG